jgi:endogenous inhibitor of DNA gyrase (YacG/DUF329 family)
VSNKKPLLVKCPNCKAEITWSKDYDHRPFCSERCKNKDFIAWGSEEHVISGNPIYDDLLSDDVHLEN